MKGPIVKIRKEGFQSQFFYFYSHRNIRRVDHHYFHGWHVAISRDGIKFSELFLDKGGEGFIKAKEWRDAILMMIAPPHRFRSSDGVYPRYENRGGEKVLTGFRAVFPGGTKSYAICKYSAKEALSLALQARQSALERIYQKRSETFKKALICGTGAFS